MKKLIVLFTVLAVTLPSFAQNEGEPENNSDGIQTLVSKNNVIGGYGALSFQYTEIDNRDAFVFGAKGAMVIGHMMAIGLGGSGFFNDVKRNEITGEDISLAGGYGGFFFEPIILPRYPVHISIPVLIGAGGVSVVSVENEYENYDSEASDAFMVIEPGIEVELNVTKFFRFCVGAYYRYTTDVNIDETDYQVPTDILQGFSGGVTFKFGKF